MAGPTRPPVAAKRTVEEQIPALRDERRQGFLPPALRRLGREQADLDETERAGQDPGTTVPRLAADLISNRLHTTDDVLGRAIRGHADDGRHVDSHRGQRVGPDQDR